MSFTQSAFIKKNTPELRRKLEELGYKRRGSWDLESDTVIQTLAPYNNEYLTFPDSDYQRLQKIYPEQIDCGTNETLFLAIAALRDDSDIHQWFVADSHIFYHLAFPDGEPFFGDIEKGEFFCMDKAMMHADIMGEESFIQDLSHKASVDELIEHFKEKER